MRSCTRARPRWRCGSWRTGRGTCFSSITTLGRATTFGGFAPLLAQHFQAANDDDRTALYATIAGDGAARLYAHAEAVTHYTSAIEAIRRSGHRDDAVNRLYRSRGKALELAGRSDAAVSNYKEMEADANVAGDAAAAAGARAALAALSSRLAPTSDP
jgi:hypothetical protein